MLYVLHSIIGKETALHSIQCSSSTAAYEVRLFLELLLLALRAASAWINSSLLSSSQMNSVESNPIQSTALFYSVQPYCTVSLAPQCTVLSIHTVVGA